MIYTVSFSIDTQKADPVRDCRIIGEIGSGLEREDIAIGTVLGYELRKFFEGIRENVKHKSSLRVEGCHAAAKC